MSTHLKVTVLSQVLTATGDKTGQDCAVLFDSGASHSFVRRDIAQAIGTIVSLPQPLRFTLADGSPLLVRDSVILSLDVAGTQVTDVFMVHPDPNPETIDELILGASTMRKFGLKLDFEHGGVFAELTEPPAVVEPPRAPANPHKERGMNEVLKRTLALLGHQTISEQLTDDDGIKMVLEHSISGAKVVATPGILTALALPETASEADAKTAIEALKALKKAEVIPAPPPDPAVVFAPVLTRLGIAATAGLDEEHIVDLIAAQVKKPAPATAAASKSVLKVLELSEMATEEEIVGALVAIKNPGNVVTVNQHKDLEAQLRAHKLESLIMKGISDGKIYPHEKDSMYDQVKEWDGFGLDGVTVLEKSIERRQKLMPIGERLPPPPKRTDAMDAAQESINAQLGVSLETFTKYAQ